MKLIILTPLIMSVNFVWRELYMKQTNDSLILNQIKQNITPWRTEKTVYLLYGTTALEEL